MELSETIVLSPADQALFVKVLLDPPEVPAALRKAMLRHDELTSETFARESESAPLRRDDAVDGS
ncbi:type II toxin -antitoxin system TacA 1-like antitoxin [Burkholderia thailandensis]|uniref:type II toxin -antitoxin system TacA 1-like antitoxin n=1 Tax=Burkholderia thailandensis TaxID=57975 RepID=UPI00298FD53A|nr:DUF1778 domain-containing protein [Burkholderia thailandensis]